MNNTALFFKKFIQHGTKIASFVPSSRFLAKQMISNIDWGKAQVVVELGAGTGPITEILIKSAPANCRLIIFESDTDFLRVLQERFGSCKNVELIGGDACAFSEFLSVKGIGKVDYIISGLPTPSLSKIDRQRLFEGVRTLLAKEGTFNQLTEMPLVYLGLYKHYFNEVKFVFEPRNFPPGGVYVCKNLKLHTQ